MCRFVVELDCLQDELLVECSDFRDHDCPQQMEVGSVRYVADCCQFVDGQLLGFDHIVFSFILHDLKVDLVDGRGMLHATCV